MFPEGRALEFLLAAVIALVVVGPKDLPILMRKLGQFVGRMRAMAAEFRASFDEMARQSELDELRKEVEAMRRGQFADVAAQAGQAEVHDAFVDIQQNLSGVTADLQGVSSPPYAEPYAPPEPEPEPETPPAPKPRARRKTAAAPNKVVPNKAVPAKAARAKAAPKTTRKASSASVAAPKTAPAKPRTRKTPEPKA
ncbi:Sec-independent protein translocase protein TatB [Phenylobacterium sp. LjRoot225]|uniref:Sec-independent protein translocase protein TatB n=1 Tax=Phenylobacterium sp. LjRoot225 TaxID=3342285 RepID=UPI003F4FEFC5